MSDYDSSSLRPLPVPSYSRVAGGRFERRWTLELSRPATSADVAVDVQRPSRAPRKVASFRLMPSSAPHDVLLVVSSTLHAADDAVMFATRRGLSFLVGRLPVRAIEGAPVALWQNANFI